MDKKEQTGTIHEVNGEWTANYVVKFLGLHSKHTEAASFLADAHNAQIAAAYKKGYEDGRTDKNTTE